MASSIQRRRGTTSDHTTFTGAVGEITIDTTKDTVVVHDGAVVGGVPLLREDLGNLPAGAVGDAKLATIATVGKVSNSATTATSALGINTIVARDGSNNFTAGTITAALTGAASSNVLKAGDTMTGALVVPLASAATPSLTFTGDLNTGIYSPGADQLAVATNGTKRLQVDAGGNISIDAVTDTGIKPLSIYSQARDCEIRLTTNSGTENNAYLILRQSGGKLDLYSTNGDIALNPGNSLAATFKSDGKVGIGTSAPSRPLHVVGSAVFNDGTVQATIWPQIATNVAGFGTNNNYPVALVTNGSQRLHVTATGNVGIGTTGPTQLLHVAGASATALIAASSGVGKINLTRGATEFEAYASTTACYVGTTSATDFGLRANNSEAARIDTSGRLLVGTSSAPGAGAWARYARLVSNGNTTDSTGAGILNLAPGKAAASIASGNGIGVISFSDNGGNEFGLIGCFADATAGSGDYPGRLVFSTAADGSASPTERMRINSSGQILSGALGTAALPIISFLSDPNTGIYSPGADQLAVATNGTGKLFINSTGDVGVGTSGTQGTKFHVIGGNVWSGNFHEVARFQKSSGTAVSLGFDNTAYVATIGAYSHDGTASDLSFWTYPGSGDVQERLRITSAGLVGIGTSSPADKLHIRLGNATGNYVTYGGTQRDANGLNKIAIFRHGYWAGSQEVASIGVVTSSSPGGAGSGSGQLVFYTGSSGNGDSGSTSTERARIDSSGRLLVGTSSTVSIAGSSPFIQHHGNKSTANIGIAGYANNLGGPILAFGASRSTTVGTPGTIVSSGDILGDIRFAGDDGTDINTTAASIRCEVDGTPGANDMPGRLVFSTTADGAASSTERMRINSSGQILSGALGTAALPIISFLSDPNTGIYSPGADQVVVATNGLGRLFIDANGNVGLGTAAPSAWSYGGNITIPGAGRYIVSTSDDIRFAANVYSSDVDRYVTNGFATRYRMADGTHQWTTAVIGTAGNAITYNESMRITAGGLVGIGTSSPTANLHIAATVSDPILFSNTNGSTFNSAIWQNNNNFKLAVGIGGGAVGGDHQDVGFVGTISNIPLSFQTNNTSRMRITAAGLVGIGTTSPVFGVGDGLEVARSGVATVRVSSNSQGVELRSDAGTGTLETRGAFPLVLGTGGTESARIDSSGRLLVGTSSGVNTGSSVQAALQVVDNNNLHAAFRMNRNDASGPIIVFGKSRSTSDGGFAVLQSNDALGTIRFAGADGGDLRTEGASIAAHVDGTPGANDMPGRLVFSTAADGSASPTERMRINSSGQILSGALGTAALPIISFLSDPNTGIYSPGADQLAVATNGTGRLFIDASGNFGVGTASPGYTLQVVSPGDNVASSAAARIGQTPYHASDGSGPHYGLHVRQLGARYHLNYGIYSEVAGDVGFFGGSTVDGFGGVRGIGVYGYSPCTTDAQQSAHGVYGKADNLSWNYNSVVGVRGLANAGTSDFLNSGSVLQAGYGGHFVSYGKANSIGVYADAYLDASPGAGQEALPLLVASNGAERLRVNASGTTTLTSTAATAPFIAKISDTEVGRFDNSGRLLVGTTDGSGGVSKLVVQGASNGSAVGVAQISYNGLSSAVLAANTDIGYLRFTDQGSNSGVFAQITASTDGTTGASDYPGRLVFATTPSGSASPVERMRITSAGLVGIGTTSPAQLLQINSTSVDARLHITNSVTGSTNSDGFQIQVNYNDVFFHLQETGDFYFQSASSTSAVIDSSGRLLVGTSSATGANLLQVNSDALVNGLTVGRGTGAISSNTAVGTNALAANTTGSFNTATGRNALLSNTTGSANTANGVNALYSNTTGASNTANGVSALYFNTTGINNTANGLSALAANTTGGSNTATGKDALRFNTTGSDNTANGVQALFANTTGSLNTAIGFDAGYGDGTQANTTGANNTFIGFDAMGASATASNVITLGNGSIATLRCSVTTITSLSDARDKTNITNLPAGLGFINALRPVAFDWNTRDGKKVGIPEFGFIAQELQDAQASTGITVPNLVSAENPDKLEASAGTLLPVLVNAVQELTAMVRDLQSELSILKGA